MTGPSARRHARIAGVLFLLSVLAGGFGEFYVPSRLVVPGDAAVTARNIRASDALFRAGFAGYLVEAVCDIALTFFLYVLLRPAGEHLALLAAFFRLVSTAVFAGAELFYFAASVILQGGAFLSSFTPDQRDGLALLSIKIYEYGGDLFMVFYGTASILLGYLIFRSRYLPKFLGVLLALGGVGFVLRNFATVLAPAYSSPFLLLPMFLAAVALTVWFLARGIDVAKWEERTAISA